MEDLQNYLQILAEEYKSLREESRQISINMFTSFQWGAAILGILIAAGFTQWNKVHVVVILTFLVIVPFITAITMFMWLGEAARFKRVGDYICMIEQKVGIVLGDFKEKINLKEKWDFYKNDIEKSLKLSESTIDLSDPLAWEGWLKDLKDRGGHISKIYLIRFLLFPILMGISFLIGAYYVFTHPKFIPSWAKFLSIPEVKISITTILIISFLFIVITITLALFFAKNLNVKTNPLVRKPFEKESENNNIDASA